MVDSRPGARHACISTAADTGCHRESMGKRSGCCGGENTAGAVRGGTRHPGLMAPLMKWLISLDICREIISHNAPHL